MMLKLPRLGDHISCYLELISYATRRGGECYGLYFTAGFVISTCTIIHRLHNTDLSICIVDMKEKQYHTWTWYIPPDPG